MKTAIACALVLVMLLGWTSPPAAVEDMGLITGSDKGTYYQFGLDLQKLVKPAGINLTVYPSKGSIENVYAVYQRPGIPMGIVQSDVLAFVARVQTDPVLQRIAKKTKMVFPLYNEEIHLLGKKGIADFDDLAGRNVQADVTQHDQSAVADGDILQLQRRRRRRSGVRIRHGRDGVCHELTSGRAAATVTVSCSTASSPR